LLATIGGLFLFLWYRTVVGLSVRRRPAFAYRPMFKWGVPFLSFVLFVVGIFLLARAGPWSAVGAAGGSALVLFLVVRFDRYSAAARIIYDRFQTIREADPAMEELEALFRTAQWRYPTWPHDRILELVAGKDIHGLILLVLITENKINPVDDWELYRFLKMKVERITHSGSGKGLR
jgi:hypothetical protein